MEWPGESADAIIDAKGLKQVTDTGAIEGMIDQVIAESPARSPSTAIRSPRSAAR